MHKNPTARKSPIVSRARTDHEVQKRKPRCVQWAMDLWATRRADESRHSTRIFLDPCYSVPADPNQFWEFWAPYGAASGFRAYPDSCTVARVLSSLANSFPEPCRDFQGSPTPRLSLPGCGEVVRFALPCGGFGSFFSPVVALLRAFPSTPTVLYLLPRHSRRVTLQLVCWLYDRNQQTGNFGLY